jgi:2-keto-myo-inositol isomerase
MLKLHPKANFKYCLDTYVIRDPHCFGRCCSSNNLEDKIRIAYEAGYDAVELWHTDLASYVTEYSGSLDYLRKFISDKGLSVPSYKAISGYFETGDQRRFKEILKYASAIGSKSVIVKILRDDHRGILPECKEVLDRYAVLLEQADHLGLSASVEFMSRARAYDSIQSAWEIVRQSNHSSAKLVLDTFHLWVTGDRQFESFDRFSQEIEVDKISIVHFTDASSSVPQQEQKDNDRKLPGMGQLDLKRFGFILRKMGFKGFLSLNTYDQSLWTKDPLMVATGGLYLMKKSLNGEVNELYDSPKWKNKQSLRCETIWSQDYLTHLDPRIIKTNRDEKLKDLLGKSLENKTVLDFKCGFSPLADYVSIGFDAFPGCVDYLRKKYPKGDWHCDEDENFSHHFSHPIDVLLHLGLGDSETEVDSHLRLRDQCKPKLVVLECCANPDGSVNEAKLGANQRWNRLKNGLVGESIVYHTDMPKRSTRLMFVGKPVE